MGAYFWQKHLCWNSLYDSIIFSTQIRYLQAKPLKRNQSIFKYTKKPIAFFFGRSHAKAFWSVLCLLLIFYSSSSYIHAQQDEWETYSYNGLQLKSKIEDHKEGKLIQYKAVKQSDVPLEKLRAVLLSFDAHKKFLQDTYISKVVDTLGGQMWKVYFEFDPPWPMPNSHCLMLYELNSTSEAFLLSGYSITDADPIRKYEPMPLSYMVYRLSKLPNGKTRIEIDAKFIPLGSAPKWMINTWFPKGPARLIEGIENVARK